MCTVVTTSSDHGPASVASIPRVGVGSTRQYGDEPSDCVRSHAVVGSVTLSIPSAVRCRPGPSSLRAETESPLAPIDST